MTPTPPPPPELKRDAPPIPVELLLAAYRGGIFPMADGRGDPDIFWVEPRERAVIPLDRFHASRSLRRTLARERFAVTCNRAFGAVIEACAAPRPDAADSWISHRIEASYRALRSAGHAHSIECWRTGDDGSQRLVGGLYGVAFDRAFCGESMFSREADASKVALAWLVATLRRAGFALLDCQFMTPHLETLGAQAMSQRAYLAQLAAARGLPYHSVPRSFSLLSADSSSPGKDIAQSFTQTS